MKATRKLADECLRTAIIQLNTSTDFKKARFANIDNAIAMLLGQVKPKIRQQFNVPLPVLSGIFDTICADLDDPIQIKVKNNSGKNLKAVHGINDSINIARKSLKPTARWDYKDRISRKYALTYGRGILKYFSAAGPYKNTLEATNPAYFHCQPRGGGLLERHLFCGEEGIIKTKKNLTDGADDGFYDEKGVDLLLERAGNKEYQEKMSSLQADKNIRFKALGLNTSANNYVGETTFNLCEWVMTKYGERWLLLFDPWSNTWLRFEKLTDVYSSGYYPYVSYATHEDDEVFWNTSILGDILYPIADSIVTLFNQDLTNRQKRNLNARLYDKDMIKNVAKLDEAQYRPDALVPVDTFGGARRLSQAVYAFETPELTGTVDLINWLEEFTGKQAGVFQDIPKTGSKGKSNNIVYATIQQLSKRVDYRAHSYAEAWGEVTLRHIQGLKDNITSNEAIKLLGVDEGLEFVENLKEIKLDRDDIEIISNKAQAQEDALRKAQKEKALTLLAEDPGINPDWKRRQIMADVGGWEQDEIEDALDMRTAGFERDQLAQAEQAIKDLLKDKDPDTCFNATTVFMRKIKDFADAHRVYLGDKFPKFIQYVQAHAQIVTENMAQLALRQRAAQQANPNPDPNNPDAGGGSTVQNMAKPTPGGPMPARVNQQ